jgi:signal transduction histidine kinase
VLWSIGVGVWDYDMVGDAMSFDDTVARFWQVEGGRPIPMSEVVERIHPDDRTRAVAEVRTALAAGSEFATTYRVVRFDGSIRVVATRGFVTRGLARQPVQLSGILWDTTLQHDAAVARERLQQQQLELKDQFLSHVSHELRSPLTVIFSFVEILLDGLAGELNEQQREFLTITQRNAAHLRQMIDDLLEVTRAQTGKLVVHIRRLELAPVVSSTIEDLTRQAVAKRIGLTGSIPPELPPVLADPDRVRQVLLNLLDNALKFTPEGGAIRVAVEGGRESAGEIVVTVSDSGPGIPEAEREEIFRQLYQLDYGAPVTRKGLGLGLFICRELVTRMGARIWVEAGAQGGSEFKFTLPVYSPVSAIESLLTPDNLARGRFHLIVVAFRPNTKRAWAEREDAAVGLALDVVRHCTLPDRDLVLPRTGASADEEAVGVLACAEAADAAVLVRRIEGQLPRCEALVAARLVWTVGLRTLDVGVAPGETARDVAGALSTRMEDVLAGRDAWRDAA